MNMARSTYYFEINKTDPVAIRNEELLLVIKKIFVENKGRYGVRRVYMELKNRGYNVNHKRVQLLYLCKSGQQMYPNLIFRGENAIFLLFWI